MSVTVHPCTVDGEVRAPGSKSVTHRALFLALLCDGGSVHDPLWSGDTLATLDVVRKLGAQVVATRNEAVVRGGPLQPAKLDARNSGTTLRLATSIAALADGTSTLTGDESLLRRPMGPLVDALGQLGAKATCKGGDGRPPVEVTGPVQGGTVRIQGDVSSQFISSLVLAGCRMPDGLTVELATELTSAPYVHLTVKEMAGAGIEATFLDDLEHGGWHVPHQRPRPARFQVPGDYSAAAFPLVAAALTGGEVTVTNMPPDTGQGDEAVLDILEPFGCRVQRDGSKVRVAGPCELQPADVDLGDNPDLFPALCVLATGCPGASKLHGAPHLRYKESDRITAMVEGLSALGVKVEPLEDGAIVHGGRIRGGRVQSMGDHRIQMAFAVAGLVADAPVTIEGPEEAHAISYPGFLDQLRDLGATVEPGVDEHDEHEGPGDGTGGGPGEAAS